MTELTELSGIGSSKADDLAEAGFETVEDIAGASVSDIQAVDGFGDNRAAEIHERALDEISVEEETEPAEDEAESEEDTEDVDEEETAEEPSEPESYVLDLDLDGQQRTHLIAGLAQREVEEIQRKDHDRADAAQDLVTQLVENGGTLEMTEDQVHLLYSAITGLTNEYHGTRGITDLARSVRDVQEVVREFRENNVF